MSDLTEWDDDIFDEDETDEGIIELTSIVEDDFENEIDDETIIELNDIAEEDAPGPGLDIHREEQIDVEEQIEVEEQAETEEELYELDLEKQSQDEETSSESQTAAKDLSVTQEQLEAELSLLKGQVNPHFLFNTLNNLYSLSLHDSKKTPELILKLSQLLSYMLYECKDETVSLEQEITFIRNYIDLEAIRVEDIADVHFKVTGSNTGHKIPPLLFIPLIENAFKHGISSEVEHSDIHIKIHIDENEIELNTENPFDETQIDDDNNHKGLGLENVNKRLELLYPNKHSLEVNKNRQYFRTRLVLKMNLQ